MIRLAQPHVPEEAISRAAEIIRSGQLVQGRCVEEFEQSLADYLEIDNAIVVSSGTAALHIALMAAGIGNEDEVIVPAFTFPATANAVIQAGAKPVMADITTADYCIDVHKIVQAITSRTRAIMPVHEFGQAADISGLTAIAKEHSLILIEDTACALGTEFNKQKAGTFGLAGCFSFHPRKAITTGEGGLIVTRDEALAIRSRALRNHGMVPQNGTSVFMHSGLNYRMTEFQAALGLGQMAGLNDQITHRIHIASLYNDQLADISWLTLPREFPERKSVYQTYHLLLSAEIDRDSLMIWLRDHGIETNYGAQALNALPYFMETFGCREPDFPEALKAYRQGLALPMGTHVGAAEVNYICDTIKRFQT